MDRVKIYKVTFRNYTNALKDTVSNRKEEDAFSLDTGGEAYIEADDLLITEDEIEAYQQFGGGIAHMTFVGWLSTEDILDVVEECRDRHNKHMSNLKKEKESRESKTQ